MNRLAFFLVLVSSSIAYAGDLHPVDPADPMSWVDGIASAAKSSEWSLVTGFALLFLTTILDKVVSRYFKKKIPRNVLPWIAICLGILTQIGVFLAMGHHWLYALSGGLVSGLVASGGYSAIGRHTPGLRKRKGAADGKA